MINSAKGIRVMIYSQIGKNLECEHEQMMDGTKNLKKYPHVKTAIMTSLAKVRYLNNGVPFGKIAKRMPSSLVK